MKHLHRVTTNRILLFMLWWGTNNDGGIRNNYDYILHGYDEEKKITMEMNTQNDGIEKKKLNLLELNRRWISYKSVWTCAC